MARTTHRSRSGKKLYAVRDKQGRFKDIQSYTHMKPKIRLIFVAALVLYFGLHSRNADARVTIRGSAAPSPAKTIIIPANLQGTSSPTVKALLRNVTNAQLRLCVGPPGDFTPLFCGPLVTEGSNPSIILIDLSLIFGGNELFIDNVTLNTGTFALDLE
jgi:hypothetical protein